MRIAVQPINNLDVLAVWGESPHASAFTHPQVLSKLSQYVDWWVAVKGKQPQCIWPVCKPENQQLGLPELTYYVGPLWVNDVFPIPAHRTLARTTEVYEAFIDRFISEYGFIHACLPKGLSDVRVFSWWNYHHDDQPKFSIRPRYTACIDNLQSMSEEAIIAGFRQLRRREIRAIEKQTPPPRTDQWSMDDIIRLYLNVVEDQEKTVVDQISQQIPALVELVRSGFGEVVAYKDSKTQKTIAACLLLFSKKDANMVLNLVDPAWRGSGLPAWMILDSISTAKSRGLTCFDFNGANSPNRGDDKHSYGAAPELYFEIKYPGEIRYE